MSKYIYGGSAIPLLCKECGAAVLNSTLHSDWHRRLAAEIERELLKEREQQCKF